MSGEHVKVDTDIERVSFHSPSALWCQGRWKQHVDVKVDNHVVCIIQFVFVV